ncbi:MAG: hypothetical protein ACYTKD_17865 [Planctomycetota bacterium]
MREPFTPVYAVVRVDDFTQPPDFPDSSNVISVAFGVTVKEVLRSAEAAQSKVDRLNRLNSDKGCRYFWQYTRLVEGPGPDGGGEADDTPVTDAGDA